MEGQTVTQGKQVRWVGPVSGGQEEQPVGVVFKRMHQVIGVLDSPTPGQDPGLKPNLFFVEKRGERKEISLLCLGVYDQ